MFRYLYHAHGSESTIDIHLTSSEVHTGMEKDSESIHGDGQVYFRDLPPISNFKAGSLRGLVFIYLFFFW